MNEGWICPKCGRGVAPTQKYCDHHSGEVPQKPRPVDYWPPVLMPSPMDYYRPNPTCGWHISRVL